MSRLEESPFAPFGKDGAGPVFEHAWHAQVLALASTLSQAGLFSPAQWSHTLGEELRTAAGQGAADNDETYYEAALKTLERLAGTGGGVSLAELSRRVEAWRRAYLNTPHGQPVELSAGNADPG